MRLFKAPKNIFDWVKYAFCSGILLTVPIHSVLSRDSALQISHPASIAMLISIGGFGVLVTAETIYRSYQKEKTQSLASLGDALQAAGFLLILQTGFLFVAGYNFGWLSPTDFAHNRSVAPDLVLTSFDTALKGALLDFMESYDLSLVRFEPESGTWVLQTIIFTFRTIWSIVTGLIVFIVIRRLRALYKNVLKKFSHWQNHRAEKASSIESLTAEKHL